MWSKDKKYREINNQMLAYNQDGEVFFIKGANTYEKLKHLGYDKQNYALKYTRYHTGNRIYRIPIDTDSRISTPVARDGNKFKKLKHIKKFAT